MQDNANPETASLFSIADTLISENNDAQRFTAIGRPMQQYFPSALSNTNYDSTTSQAPQFLPVKFTDDSKIKIAIPYADLPPLPPSPSDNQNQPRKKSFVGKLGSKLSLSAKNGDGDGEGTNKKGFRMIEMTRREYLMYWAKDEQGRYIGTEPKGKGAEIWRERGF